MAGPEWIFHTQTALAVTYLMQNHSDSPAAKVFAQCFLENAKGFDLAGLNTNSFAAMPREPMRLHALIFTGKEHSSSGILDLINRGKVGIKIYVLYFSSMGKKKSFVQTFYKIHGRFSETSMEFDPTEKEVTDMIERSSLAKP